MILHFLVFQFSTDGENLPSNPWLVIYMPKGAFWTPFWIVLNDSTFGWYWPTSDLQYLITVHFLKKCSFLDSPWLQYFSSKKLFKMLAQRKKTCPRSSKNVEEIWIISAIEILLNSGKMWFRVAGDFCVFLFGDLCHKCNIRNVRNKICASL